MPMLSKTMTCHVEATKSANQSIIKTIRFGAALLAIWLPSDASLAFSSSAPVISPNALPKEILLHRAADDAKAKPLSETDAEVEARLKQELAHNEKTHGPDHVNTAVAAERLARLYLGLRHLDEAKPLFKRALNISEKTLGPEHPNTGIRLNNLAAVYYAQGIYDQAEPLFKRALAIDEKTFEPDHPSIRGKLNNLAALYRAQGKYDKAEPLFKRAVESYETSLGPNHPSTKRVKANYEGMKAERAVREDTKAKPASKTAAEAEGWLKQDLADAEKTHGPDHLTTGTRLNNLALLYHAQGKYDQAEPLFKRALDITEKALGPDHPKTKRTKANYMAIKAAIAAQEGISK